MTKILFIANNNFGVGLSGGDRIFLELARHWQTKTNITILGGQETKNLIKKYHIKKIRFIKTDTSNPHPKPTTFNIVRHQIKRTFKAIKLIPSLTKFDYVYSVSDFYPDLLPALLLKLLRPKTIWLAGYYLFSSNPFSPNSPYLANKEPIKGLIYFLGQIPSRFLVKLFADFVLVTSKPDTQKFPKKNTIVVQGGVDLSPLKHYNPIPINQRRYDACFIGRLHPQKGVLQLVDIWSLVVLQKPSSRLAIIGNGDLKNQLSQKIKKMKLQKNITTLGFLEGQKKYKIFQNSKMVLHPAIFDSGGMAAAEAMAWGLPAVSFDLPALKTYYPQGMIKTPCFDHAQFAKNICRLLDNKRLYQSTGIKASKLIATKWDWNKKASEIFNTIFQTQ